MSDNLLNFIYRPYWQQHLCLSVIALLTGGTLFVWLLLPQQQNIQYLNIQHIQLEQEIYQLNHNRRALPSYSMLIIELQCLLLQSFLYLTVADMEKRFIQFSQKSKNVLKKWQTNLANDQTTLSLSLELEGSYPQLRQFIDQAAYYPVEFALKTVNLKTQSTTLQLILQFAQEKTDAISSVH